MLHAVPPSQINMGCQVHLRVSVFLLFEDPIERIEHLIRLNAIVLTLPEGMPLPGIEREVGAAIKATVQCIPKVIYNGLNHETDVYSASCKQGI